MNLAYLVFLSEAPQATADQSGSTDFNALSTKGDIVKTCFVAKDKLSVLELT